MVGEECNEDIFQNRKSRALLTDISCSTSSKHFFLLKTFLVVGITIIDVCVIYCVYCFNILVIYKAFPILRFKYNFNIEIHGGFG